MPKAIGRALSKLEGARLGADKNVFRNPLKRADSRGDLTAGKLGSRLRRGKEIVTKRPGRDKKVLLLD